LKATFLCANHVEKQKHETKPKVLTPLPAFKLLQGTEVVYFGSEEPTKKHSARYRFGQPTSNSSSCAAQLETNRELMLFLEFIVAEIRSNCCPLL
jgi:hypothetical protein